MRASAPLSPRARCFLCSFGLDAGALERRQVLDEDLAEQMVHLVLDAHGEQALGVELERLAALVQRAHADPRGARAPCRSIRAPTGSLPRTRLLLRPPIELGIDEHPQVVAALGDVDDDARACARRPASPPARRPAAAYIVSAMSSTSLRISGVDRRHRRCNLVQARIGVFEYRKQGHCVIGLPNASRGCRIVLKSLFCGGLGR